MSETKSGLLTNLGVYGYGHIEDVVVAALVTGKPLLLIGKAGTGKSFLLNSLSEALAEYFFLLPTPSQSTAAVPHRQMAPSHEPELCSGSARTQPSSWSCKVP